MNRLTIAALTWIVCIATVAMADDAPGVFNVRRFDAVGDGETDDTAAFQRALDAAGETGSATVCVPRGNYLFLGHLNVPQGVTLAGVWQSVPAHSGIRDRGLPKPTDDGTTFLITEGAGSEEGSPFLTLNTNCTLRGVVLYYPEQNADDVPKPYPWAIAMRGKNPAVLDVEMLNPYNGIDATRNERHLIRNVHGQPLRRGILIDAIFDIGRVENVHFNPWWSMKPKLFQWQLEHGEAFILGRSDWQYVLNTFCFGYNVGYKFIESESGVCNGNFLGLGADACHTCVLVEQSARFGLLITNGQFVAFNGPNPTMVQVGPEHRGSVRFNNCAFWGPCHQIAQIAGRGTVGFSDCTFAQWDAVKEGRHAIQAQSGTLLVRGCEFNQAKPQIELGEKVRRAVIMGNVFRGARQITNRSQATVHIIANAADPPPPPPSQPEAATPAEPDG
ncbi:MAG: glycosyl hydrolase family 28-related protein [Pirellulales bacterium]